VFQRRNVTVNVAAASNRCLQFRRDPPLTFNRLFAALQRLYVNHFPLLAKIERYAGYA